MTVWIRMAQPLVAEATRPVLRTRPGHPRVYYHPDNLVAGGVLVM